LKIKRNVLLNPGPATTTDSVKLAQLVPDICPREKEFSQIMQEIQEDLVKIVHGDRNVYTAVLFCGSGTLNMDVCLNSLLPANKKALIINDGSYSSRAVEICRAYGLSFIELRFPITAQPCLDTIEKTLKENTDIALIYATHNETGTGILNPIREIGALARQHDAVFIVDTTSTYAMLPIDIEENHIDFCMASAQKGIMGMTGLSFVIGRMDEIEKSKAYPLRSYYCNLYLQYEYFKKTGQMRFTPPVQTIYAARQALREYFIEGEMEKWRRHQRTFQAIKQGCKKIGLRELIPDTWQAGLVTALLYPDDENWNFERIHDYCYERGFTIYPGKVTDTPTFRLCALGAIDEEDIYAFWQVFCNGLNEMGVKIPLTYRKEEGRL